MECAVEPSAMPSPYDRLVRRTLREFAPYRPGTSVGAVRERFGISAPVKLSQNENPLGTSPRALEALRALDSLGDYVEDDHRPLRARLAARYALAPENVAIGHGSNELLAIAYTAFVDPGDDVVMARPTFALFRKDADIAGARALEIPLHNGVHDLEAMLAAVTPATKLVFVCDPNNPTGTRVNRAALAAFADALPAHVLLIVDQAYREFMDADGADAVDLLRKRPTTLVLRTASKIYGLAAVRFGYGYSSPEIVAAMNRVRVPFNVSRPAAAAVHAALDDTGFIARSIENNERGKNYLADELEQLGLPAFRSAANFIAVEVPVEAETAYEGLIARGVIVRSGDGLGLPRHLRVSVGMPRQNEAFIAALTELLPAWRETAALGAAR